MFNMMKTAILMAAITALFMAIGAMIGGRSGMMLALVVALGMNFFSYWFSDKMVLKMYNAQEVDASSAPHFYRMVQELIGNVLKHAKARHVNIQLLENEGNLLLTVEDDGQGFDPKKIESDGIGLSNIRTRAEVLRAKMHLDSAPGKGTFVSVEIPML